MFSFKKILPLIIGFILGYVLIDVLSTIGYNKGKIEGLKEGLEIGYKECNNDMDEISDLNKKSLETYHYLDSLKNDMQIKYEDIAKKVLQKRGKK